jgi:hypothetical protein
MFRKIDGARELVKTALLTWEQEERKNRISFEDVTAIDTLFCELTKLSEISNPSPSFWITFHQKLRQLSSLIHIAETRMGYVSIAPI